MDLLLWRSIYYFIISLKKIFYILFYGNLWKTHKIKYPWWRIKEYMDDLYLSSLIRIFMDLYLHGNLNYDKIFIRHFCNDLLWNYFCDKSLHDNGEIYEIYIPKYKLLKRFFWRTSKKKLCSKWILFWKNILIEVIFQQKLKRTRMNANLNE